MIRRLIFVLFLAALPACAQVGTPISTCQNITASGNYYLSANLTAARSCIGMQASNVTLDLFGHTITYDNTFSVPGPNAQLAETTTYNSGTNVCTVTLNGGDSPLPIAAQQIFVPGDGICPLWSGSMNTATLAGPFPMTISGGGLVLTFTPLSSGGVQSTTNSPGGNFTLQYAYGIGFQQCSQSYADPAICGNGGLSNITIYSSVAGGTITSANNGDLNGGGEKAIGFGQLSGTCQNITIHDITINTANAGLNGVAFPYAPLNSGPIFLDFCANGGKVYNVTATTGYGRSENRQALLGAPFYFVPSSGGGTATPSTSTICQLVSTPYTPSLEVCNNTVTGGAQGSIVNEQSYYHIHNNTLAPSDSAVDGFAVNVWGGGGEVDHNTINVTSGRGIQICALNCSNSSQGTIAQSVHDNTVTTRMLPQYCTDVGQPPCNTCEPFGTYGIEWKYAIAPNSTSFNNNVTVFADQCNAAGLRVTGIDPTATDHNNTYTAILSGTKCVGSQASPCQAIGIGIDNALSNEGGVGHFTQDSFTADDATLFVDNGSQGLQFNNCTFIKPATAAADHVFIRWGTFQSNPSNAIHVQDATFSGGEDPTTNQMFTISGIHAYEEYFIDWTYTPTVLNGASPVAGVVVTYTDAQSNNYTCTTNPSGTCSVVLTQYHPFNSASAVTTPNSLNPYSVSLGSPCTFSATGITVNATTSISYSCNGGAGTPAATLTPSSIAFGNQNIHTTSAVQFATLSSTGSAALSVSAITVSGSFSNSGTGTCAGTSFTLPQGTSCTIGITFSPSVTGPASGTLSVSDNAATSPQTSALSGTGTAPVASWSPTSYAFGNWVVGGSLASSPLTLNNTGTGPLNVALTITGTNAANFAIASTTCSSILAAGSNCSVTVNFNPTAVQSYVANLTETDSVQSIVQNLGMNGSGVKPTTAPWAPVLTSKKETYDARPTRRN